jgi:hypothetical protein
MMSEKTIKFVSYDKSAEMHYPPIPVSKIIPKWYKDVPLSFDHDDGEVKQKDVPTIKKCVPVLDYLTSGYVILNSYETEIRFEEDKEGILRAHNICPAADYVSGHPFSQAPVLMNGVKNHYFKISNPWKVITPPGYSCHFYQPFFTLNENYKMFPAVVDTDKHNDAVNFVGVGLKKQFTIKPGEPLMVVYPFKRDDWKMETSYDDFTSKNSFKYWTKSLWHGTYARLFHSRKKFR